MWLIILMAVLAVVGLILLITPARILAVVPALLIGLLFLTFGVATVEAKHVGVKTTFGKTAEEPLSSGFHWKAPWAKVTELDSTIQTWEYAGESAIDVVLADKNEAKVSATIRWSVNDEKASDVFAEFRTADDGPTDGLGDAVVGTQFKAALWSVFDKHDLVAEDALSAADLAEQVKTAVEANTRGMVVIESVTISKIVPGPTLQNKIEEIQAQKSQTVIAEEKKLTAAAEAAANRELSASLDNNPGVLVSKCLDIVASGIPLPYNFQCMEGGASGVVLPSAAK